MYHTVNKLDVLIKPTRCTNFVNLVWTFVKLVHLVGFIIKTFVTMHGHTNVENWMSVVKSSVLILCGDVIAVCSEIRPKTDMRCVDGT